MAREIITLSNGKKVANFSSPHSFTFTDGSEIPAVDAEESVRLKVTFNEDVDEDGDVKLSFTLSDAVIKEMEYWMNMYTDNKVDVVFCPLPMITAIKEEILEFDKEYSRMELQAEIPGGLPVWELDQYFERYSPKVYDAGVYNLKASPFRAVRMEDRIEKLLSIEKQCL